MYKLKYRWLWLSLGFSLIALILFLSLMPTSSIPKLGYNDKILHFMAYFVVAIWFVGIILPRYFLILGLLLLAFSYGIEILQGMTRYRQFEWLDLLANGSGIFAALLLGILLLKGWCQVFEKKLLTP